MADLFFESRLSWAGKAGQVQVGGENFRFSVPASMGGLGVGTNPEELLLSAVGACYTATLSGLLNSAGLPAAAVGVRVDGTVSDHPGPSARVSSLVVNPTFIGADAGRESDYEKAAVKARERCFIGRHLGPQVSYRVGEVAFAEAEATAAGVLDVRALPAPRRHELIFSRLAELEGGGAITLINDHDPKPLHYQLEATQPGRFSWDYLEQGPEAWRVRIVRRPT